MKLENKKSQIKKNNCSPKFLIMVYHQKSTFYIFVKILISNYTIAKCMIYNPSFKCKKMFLSLRCGPISVLF